MGCQNSAARLLASWPRQLCSWPCTGRRLCPTPWYSGSSRYRLATGSGGCRLSYQSHYWKPDTNRQNLKGVRLVVLPRAAGGAVGLRMHCKLVFLGAILRLHEIYSKSYDLQHCTSAPALIYSLGELLFLSPLITYDIYSPSGEHTVPMQ